MKKVKKPLSRKHLQLVLDRCMVQLKEVNVIAERQRKELRKREETAAILRQVVAQLKFLTVGLMQQWKTSDDAKRANRPVGGGTGQGASGDEAGGDEQGQPALQK